MRRYCDSQGRVGLKPRKITDVATGRNVTPGCDSTRMIDNSKRTKRARKRDKEPLPERLSDLLHEQYNVIARWQAIEYGLTDSQLRHRLRPGGPWQKILPGVYSVETGTVTPDQRQMAALLYAGPASVLTGAAAVRRHHLNCAGGNDVEILVPAKSQVAGHGYVHVHRTARMPDSFLSARKIRYAPLPRAAGDAARAMPKPEDVRALVSEVLHRSREGLNDLLQELAQGPLSGSAQLRAAIAEVSEGIRSEAERDLKFCINGSRLPAPLYNARLYLPDGTFLAMTDAWWPRAGVAGEVDSLSHHILAQDHEDTTARRNRMEAADIRVLQFLPKDIKPSWPIHLQHLEKAIESGMKRPPLNIITVPADVTDVQTFLWTKLSNSNGGIDADPERP